MQDNGFQHVLRCQFCINKKRNIYKAKTVDAPLPDGAGSNLEQLSEEGRTLLGSRLCCIICAALS